MSRPVNPSFIRWFAAFASVAGVFYLLMFALGDQSVTDGVLAAALSLFSAVLFTEWRRRRRTYREWLERGQK